MANILIVDDSETLRHEVRRSLETAGHRVLEAQDGLEGLEILGAHPEIQLLICDVNMPRMDGLTMCQKFAAVPDRKKIPIFMLTTESSPEMKEKGKQVGVTAWITKTFDPAKLLGAIEKVLKLTAAT